jgi:ribosomal protein L17
VTGESVRYPSVTTILGVINKPALVPWAAKEERVATSEAAADLYADLHGAQQLPRAMYLLALEQRLGKTKAHTKALAKAAEIGSAIHGKIEWTLKRALGLRVGAEPLLHDAALWGFMAFEDWAKAVRLQPQFIEQVVYSRTHQYAGTMDLCATLDAAALLGVLERQGAVDATLGDWLRARDSVTALIDFKSGKAVYGEALLQSCAYSRALAEMGHGRVDGGLIVRLPKVTSDPSFSVHVVPPARELFPVFLAAKALWQWSYNEDQAYRARRAEIA